MTLTTVILTFLCLIPLTPAAQEPKATREAKVTQLMGKGLTPPS